MHGDLPPQLAALLAAPQPLTSTPSFAHKIGDPSPGQRKHCYLALEVTAQALLANPRQPLSALNTAIANVAGANARTAAPRVRLNARTLLMHLPAGARNAAKDIEAARRALTGPAAASQELLSAKGLFVRLPGNTLLALEVHPATRPGGTSDSWMNRRTTLHRQLGSTVPGFDGVVVLTPRCDAAAVHLPARGARHTLGQCQVCGPMTLCRPGAPR